MPFAFTGMRESVPLTTQPSVCGPGGVGQLSFQYGGFCARRRVLRVEHVDEVVAGAVAEARVDGQAEQATVVAVEHARREVDEVVPLLDEALG